MCIGHVVPQVVQVGGLLGPPPGHAPGGLVGGEGAGPRVHHARHPGVGAQRGIRQPPWHLQRAEDSGIGLVHTELGGCAEVCTWQRIMRTDDQGLCLRY